MLSRLRLTELSLLVAPILLALVGLANVNLVRTGAVVPLDGHPIVVLAGFLVVAHAALTVRCRNVDQLILPIAGMLTALGLILVGRLESEMLERQTLWIVVGALFLIVVVGLPKPVSWLKEYKYTWAVLGLLLAAVTLVFGKDVNNSGARLWLGYGDWLFQPSEGLKILLVVFLAGYLDDKRELFASGSQRVGFLRVPGLPHLGPMAVMWGLSILLLIGQRELGPPFLLFGVFLAMLYVASSRGIYVWGGLAMFSAAAYGLYNVFSHVQTRVDIWLNPWTDPDGKAYQIVQSLLALATGGIAGTGLGFGHPNTIPAVHTDFPFSAVGEELGLFGTLAVVLLYLLLTYRGLKIALGASDSFQQLLATGLTTTIGLQALIIIAGNIKLIPLTGITLPFVSYGGSSLVTNFIAIGLLLRTSEGRARST